METTVIFRTWRGHEWIYVARGPLSTDEFAFSLTRELGVEKSDLKSKFLFLRNDGEKVSLEGLARQVPKEGKLFYFVIDNRILDEGSFVPVPVRSAQLEVARVTHDIKLDKSPTENYAITKTSIEQILKQIKSYNGAVVTNLSNIEAAFRELRIQLTVFQTIKSHQEQRALTIRTDYSKFNAWFTGNQQGTEKVLKSVAKIPSLSKIVVPAVLLKDSPSRSLSDLFSQQELNVAVDSVKREEEHVQSELVRVVASRWRTFNSHLDDAISNNKFGSVISAKLPQFEKELETFRAALKQHQSAETLISGDYEAFFKSAKPAIFNYNEARDLRSKHNLLINEAAKFERSLVAYIGELSTFRKDVDEKFIANLKQLTDLNQEAEDHKKRIADFVTIVKNHMANNVTRLSNLLHIDIIFDNFVMELIRRKRWCVAVKEKLRYYEHQVVRCFLKETTVRSNVITEMAYVPKQLSHLLELTLLLPGRDPSLEKLGEDLPDLEKLFPLNAEKSPAVHLDLEVPVDPRSSEAYKKLKADYDRLEAQLRDKAREVKTGKDHLMQLSSVIEQSRAGMSDKIRIETLQAKWDEEKARLSSGLLAAKIDMLAAKEAEEKAEKEKADLTAQLEAQSKTHTDSEEILTVFKKKLEAKAAENEALAKEKGLLSQSVAKLTEEKSKIAEELLSKSKAIESNLSQSRVEAEKESQRLRDLDSKLRSESSEKLSLSLKVKEKDAKIEEFRRELERVKEDKARFSSDAETLRKEKVSLSEELSKRKSIENSSKQSLTELEMAKEALAKEKEVLTKEKVSLNEELSKRKAEEALSKKSLLEAEAAKATLVKEKEALAKEKDAILKEKATLAAELSKANAAEAQARADKAKIEEDHKKSQLDVSQSSSQTELLKKQILELNTRLVSSNSTEATLRKDLEKAKAEVDKLTKKAQDSTEVLSNMAEEIKTLKENLENAQAVKKSLGHSGEFSKIVEDLLKTNEDSEVQKAKLRKDLEAVSSELAQLKETLKHAELEASKVSSDSLKKAEIEILKLKETLTKIEGENSKLKTSIADSQKRDNESHAKKTELERQNDILLKERQEAFAKISKIEEELREKDNAHKKLAEDFQEIVERMEDVDASDRLQQEQIKALTEEVETLRTVITEKDAEFKRAEFKSQQRIQEVNAQKEKLVAEMASLKKRNGQENQELVTMISSSKAVIKKYSPNFQFNYDFFDQSVPYLELFENFCAAGLHMALSAAPISFNPITDSSHGVLAVFRRVVDGVTPVWHQIQIDPSMMPQPLDVSVYHREPAPREADKVTVISEIEANAAYQVAVVQIVFCDAVAEVGSDDDAANVGLLRKSKYRRAYGNFVEDISKLFKK